MNHLPRLLIALDDPDTVGLLSTQLSGLDCIIEIASTGHEAIAAANRFRPDLILTGELAPPVTGFDLCRTIKSDLNTRRIMLFMLTPMRNLTDVERAVQAQIDDFISTPPNKDELLKRVTNFLRRCNVAD